MDSRVRFTAAFSEATECKGQKYPRMGSLLGHASVATKDDDLMFWVCKSGREGEVGRQLSGAEVSEEEKRREKGKKSSAMDNGRDQKI
ncbi:hypothetical protein HPP92_019827 [Vanilla planifolia]|uniref:Uncharacterized protein n=1 Tax=Vanilla planifolia TaxID=51239 RepID=A0A835QB26_VANPL|nr:hypothetical protein HPP92_019827 [Vanilla planifolia]